MSETAGGGIFLTHSVVHDKLTLNTTRKRPTK